MAAPMTHRRVLTYLQKAGENNFRKAKFTQSLVDWLNGGTEEDKAQVYIRVDDDKLIISDSTMNQDSTPIKVKRPHFCPIHNLSESENNLLSEDTKTRGVDTGAATLVESSDNKILLIRRAHHMRTFPGVWVPPGGHLEVGEQPHEAGLRELEEEAGMKITLDMCHQHTVPVLAMWESVFPPMLSSGLPRRHHAVVYLHVKLLPPYTATFLQEQLKPDPEEVGACAWVDRNVIQAIVASSDDGPQQASNTPQIPQTFRSLIVPRDKESYMEDLQTSVLLNKATGQKVDIERVSTGTKFALSEWLKATQAQTDTTSRM